MVKYIILLPIGVALDVTPSDGEADVFSVAMDVAITVCSTEGRGERRP